MYGNIGAVNRLDFTVLGSAVNTTSRMERVGKDLGVHLVVSGEFASVCKTPMTYLGDFEMSGLDQPIQIFGRDKEGVLQDPG